MISQAAWRKYIGKLAAIDKKAADQMRAWVDKNGLTDDKALIDYAYGLATKYGEASATLSCEMYDTMSGMMKAGVPDAVPAETATYEEVAKGVMWGKYHSPSQIPGIVGRQVRQAGADTMMKNAGRDQAEWAWVPQGDTCAFCITLASNGWQKASSAVLRGNHADHIHQNCDCTFAISFKEKDKKQYDYIYDPQKYKDMYYGADGDTPNERMNYIRRQIYDRNKDEINAQKRDAYQARQFETMSSNALDGMLLQTDKSYGSKMVPFSERGIEVPEIVSDVLSETTEAGEYYKTTKRISNDDLRVMSIETGCEFVRFTIDGITYILRGEEKATNIPKDLLALLKEKKGTMDIHCHPFIGDYIPSMTDREWLETMEPITGQTESQVISVDGMRAKYNKSGIIHIEAAIDDESLSDEDKAALLRLFGEG